MGRSGGPRIGEAGGPRAPRAGGGFGERLGLAVDYLEARLDGCAGEPDAAGAAEAAGWSEWHFMRLFRAASGMAVSEYVRARRLSRAAAALASSPISALEAAVEAGYESQAAFSRAFAREFGLSPTAYRRRFSGRKPPGLVAPFEPRVPFEPPEPRVRVAELPALELLGVGFATSARAYRAFRELPRFWEDWLRRRRWRELPGAAPGRPSYGLCSCSAEAEIEYYICLEAPPGAEPPPGWSRIRVPSGRYAISEAAGPQPLAIQGATLAAYARWLPSSGYERGEGWDVEAYYPGAPGRSELRLPLAPREP